MAVTMKEIARIAGVSQPAVSAALTSSGTTKVSEKMCLRILKIAEELNYVPNNAAQRLKGGATHTIGLYGVPYVSVLTQALVLELSLRFAEENYNLISCYGSSVEASAHAMKQLVAKGVDGVIIMTPENNPLSYFKKVGIPYVYAPPFQAEGFDLAVDHERGGFLAASEMIACGAKRIGFLAIDSSALETKKKAGSNSNPTFEKYTGYCGALEANSIPFRPEFVLTHNQFKFQANLLCAHVKKLRLDALMCSNDFLAAGIMHPLLSRGVRIPQDLMITGYDGLSLCSTAPVPLSTVIQPNAELATSIVKLLLDRIARPKNASEPLGRKLQPVFYASESSGGRPPDFNVLQSSDTYSTLELNWNFAGK